MKTLPLFLATLFSLSACAAMDDQDDMAGDLGKADELGLPEGEPADVPLAVKSSGFGFAPIEFIRNQTCELYGDRVVVYRQYGTVTTEETRPLTITGDLADVIDSALQDPVEETDNFLCDGPSTFVSAGGETLYSTGGCGTPKSERQGPATRIVLDILNEYCPKTH